MKAFPDAHDWKICAVASQKITQELGLQHTPGILFREPGAPRPERNPKAWEMFRGMQTNVDVQELAAEVQALHRQSKTGQNSRPGLSSTAINSLPAIAACSFSTAPEKSTAWPGVEVSRRRKLTLSCEAWTAPPCRR